MPASKPDPARPLVIEVVDPQVAAILRGKTGPERLVLANDLFVAARRMLLSHLQAEHPDWDQQQLEQESARRISHRTE